jgi:hypothetical protein
MTDTLLTLEPGPAAAVCPECAAPGVGGQAGCQALHDQLALLAYANLPIAAQNTLAFDAYCMQHIEPYCHSAKSYAAHLTRLCCGMERGGDPIVYAAIQRWLNGPIALDRPAVLAQRGDITIASLLPATTPGELALLMGQWSASVWAAYASQHELARRWIALALGEGQKPQRSRTSR